MKFMSSFAFDASKNRDFIKRGAETIKIPAQLKLVYIKIVFGYGTVIESGLY